MSLSQKQKTLLLLGFHLLWGSFLWWSIAPNGLGTSRDSADYLFTSLSLVEGRGFHSFSGQPYENWPPLYPLLLAGLQLLGGWDPYVSAHILHFFTFLLLAYCITRICLRIFPENFPLAFAANALSAVGVAHTMLSHGAGSDYLHLALVLALALQAGEYIQSNRPQTVWWMTLLSALAMLQRYLGAAALLSSVLVVFFFTRAAIWERLKRTAWLGTSLLPLGAWILSVSTDTLQRGSPRDFIANLQDFTTALLGWFFSPATLQDHPLRAEAGLWLIWLVIIGCALLLLSLGRGYLLAHATAIAVLLYGFIYVVVLQGIASLTYFNRLEDRFVSPLYVPFVMLVLLAIQTALASVERRAPGLPGSIARIGAASLIAIMIAFALRPSVERAIQMHSNGEGYTTAAWNHNPALSYWKTIQPGGPYVLFSNYPAGIALHLWQPAFPSPRRSPNPNDDSIYPLEGYKAELFQPGKQVYLIWIEPNTFPHVYTLEELHRIAVVEVLFEGSDGGVYKLAPIP